MTIKIVDIFAGPGGLGEGFNAFKDPETDQKAFEIVLSVEKDHYAHQTLTLRSFFHQFQGNIPEDYYRFVRGELPLQKLFDRWPEEAEKAIKETWNAELGEGEKATAGELVDEKIQVALNGSENWILIGGPPCQAYSVVGRSRRKEKILDPKKDERVGLYKQYLRILAAHNPPIFIMENVKGLLSAQTKESPVFKSILRDLSDPLKAYLPEYGNNGSTLHCPGYNVFSLVTEPEEYDAGEAPVFSQNNYIIYTERHGIPQSRHRVILLGIRKNIDLQPNIIPKEEAVILDEILSGLPELRSCLSKRKDNMAQWKSVFSQFVRGDIMDKIDDEVRDEIIRQLQKIKASAANTGSEFIPYDNVTIDYRPDWFLDSRLKGVCNHNARGHMESDLLRYLFVACFGKVKKKSPKLVDFPSGLLPLHKNVEDGIAGKTFDDRFRVQLSDKTCKTVTSHISKDGHYYIHPDPSQCRSFTVREAARAQTFPDNYYFCGSRTAQFVQVGNAVPPLLANKIASIVNELFDDIFCRKAVKRKRHLFSAKIQPQIRFN
ncbi:MAG: DNA cytosine methyltransferase [Thermodesulfobacteriota bacterium]|nr:DNA cytosine methyltransferase [Thermodesulfobacteriota bacterium]